MMTEMVQKKEFIYILKFINVGNLKKILTVHCICYVFLCGLSLVTTIILSEDKESLMIFHQFLTLVTFPRNY